MPDQEQRGKQKEEKKWNTVDLIRMDGISALVNRVQKTQATLEQKWTFRPKVTTKKPELGVVGKEMCGKLTAINSLHGDVVHSIIDKL